MCEAAKAEDFQIKPLTCQTSSKCTGAIRLACNSPSKRLISLKIGGTVEGHVLVNILGSEQLFAQLDGHNFKKGELHNRSNRSKL